MKEWTTKPQLTWLKEKVPGWYQAQGEKRVREFLDNLILRFYEKFSIPASQWAVHDKQIRKWFYNHSTSSQSRALPAVPTTIDFTKAKRKVVRLTLYQAYSLFYCTRDSALYAELMQDWKLYTSGDTTAYEKYKRLFPAKPNRKLPFVAFQQTILKDKITMLPGEQLAVLQEFIEGRFKKETNQREHPWLALKVDDDQLDVDLERQYVKGQVNGLTSLLDSICSKVKDRTNFNTLVLTGRPNPMGTGGIQLFHVGSGETVITGKTFDQFLGLLWDTVKNKYWEWLNQCYSRDETYRVEGSVCRTSQTSNTPATSQSPEPESSQSPAPDAEMDTMPANTTSVDATLADMSVDATSADTTSADTTSADTASADTPGIDPTLARISIRRTPTPTTVAAQTPTIGNDTLDNLDGVSSPSRQAALPSCAGSPSWTLGPQHRAYVHSAVSYLIGAPGGPQWQKLLGSYILFESLLSIKSGESKMPTDPCPKEIPIWFKFGRRFTGKSVPMISSIEEFEVKWVEWWTVGQPQWRGVRDWPFAKRDAAGNDWGHVLEGGKDGMFLVVVSLAWWVCARGSLEKSKLDDAIEDVTWVLDCLIARLSADAMSSDPPATASPAQRRTRRSQTTTSRAAKRVRS